MLQVVIKSPTEIIWEGEAASISSENSVGPFDILPQHANFITLIKNKPIVIERDSEKKLEFMFARAVILAQNDRISIYSQIEYKR